MGFRMLRFPEGKVKAVTFSYDDGCRADIRLAATLNRYGMKGTFNLNSGMFGKDTQDWHLTKEEIEEHLIGAGHEIAVHGEMHKAPGALRAAEGILDVMNCRYALEKMFGQIVRGMAYPNSGITHFENGTTYDTVKGYLTDLGIAYARTLGGDNNSFDLPTDWHAWMPTAHHENPKLMEYIDQFVSLDMNKIYSADRFCKLFYLWGHAFEFDRNDNWDRLEMICEKLSGKEEIWYASNIEICDYVAAYNALRFSADGSIVYNPTVTTVWFDIDGALHKIEPGETLFV